MIITIVMTTSIPIISRTHIIRMIIIPVWILNITIITIIRWSAVISVFISHIPTRYITLILFFVSMPMLLVIIISLPRGFSFVLISILTEHCSIISTHTFPRNRILISIVIFQIIFFHKNNSIIKFSLVHHLNSILSLIVMFKQNDSLTTRFLWTFIFVQLKLQYISEFVKSFFELIFCYTERHVAHKNLPSFTISQRILRSLNNIIFLTLNW